MELVKFHPRVDEDDNQDDLITSNRRTDMLFVPACTSMQVIKLMDDWTTITYQIPFNAETLHLMVIRGNIIFFVAKSHLKQLQCYDLVEIKRYYSIWFKENILGLKISAEYLIVILHTSVHIYTLETKRSTSPRVWPRKFSIHNRIHLKPAMVSIAMSKNGLILSLPTSSCRQSIGLVMVAQHDTISTIKRIHSTPVSCIALNSDATLVATAGDKGKVIKVFNAQGTMLHKIQRTHRRFRTIYSLTFSPDSKFIVCCSKSRRIPMYNLAMLLSETAIVKSSTKKKKKNILVSFKFTTRKFPFIKSVKKKKLSLSRPFAVITKPSDLKKCTKVHGFNVNYKGDNLQLVLSERSERVRIFNFNTTVKGDCILQLDLDISKIDHAQIQQF